MLTKVMSTLSKQTYKNFEVIVVDNNSQIILAGGKIYLLMSWYDQYQYWICLGQQSRSKRSRKGEWLFYSIPMLILSRMPGRNYKKDTDPQRRLFACALIDAINHHVWTGWAILTTYGLHWRTGHGYPCDITPKHPIEIFSARSCAYIALKLSASWAVSMKHILLIPRMSILFRLRLIGGKSLLLPNAKVHHVGSGITEVATFLFIMGIVT